MILAYINAGAGVAGDMLLSACVDASGEAPAAFARRFRGQLLLSFEWRIGFRRVEKGGFPGLRLSVEGDRVFSGPEAMKRAVRASRLPAPVKAGTAAVLDLLVRAEAHAHRSHGDHWHELARVDTVVDVAGTLLALHGMGVERVQASEVLVGRLAPAAAWCLRGLPVRQAPRPDIEVTTPTGAALLKHLAAAFSPTPLMTLSACGFGAGTIETPWPNVLSVSMGTSAGRPQAAGTEELVVLETNIDDMDPRVYPYVIEKLLAAGARDAWTVPIVMKKGRPAHTLSVLVAAPLAPEAARLLFAETTTLGLRASRVERWALPRRQNGARKTAAAPGGSRTAVEFEAAAALARKTGKPLKDLLRP